jgi:hypothetical protein
MKRFAIALVVEVDGDADKAWEQVTSMLSANYGGFNVCYVGDPCPVPVESADSYMTERIVLRDEPVSSLIVTDPSAPE